MVSRGPRAEAELSMREETWEGEVTSAAWAWARTPVALPREVISDTRESSWGWRAGRSEAVML
jgi:hypothetical protein